jgi:isoprenylcysteine carboxyl methyltransferase (ICMT) family protein YpbQ
MSKEQSNTSQKDQQKGTDEYMTRKQKELAIASFPLFITVMVFIMAQNPIDNYKTVLPKAGILIVTTVFFSLVAIRELRYESEQERAIQTDTDQSDPTDETEEIDNE